MGKKIGGTLLLLVTAGFYWFLTWLLSLSWNLHFGITWVNIGIISIVVLVSIAIFVYRSDQELPAWLGAGVFIPIGIFVISGIISLINSPVFSAKKYYNYVAERVTVIADNEEQSAFPNLIGSDGDTSNLPLYGSPEAIKRAETEMGKYPALGSQFELLDEDLTSQSIKNSLSYVIPLQPKSVSKWDKDQGNNGYFIIDRNTGETKFIEHSLKYTTEAPFGSSAMRKLRSFDKHSGITDISPEVDDNGVFHYVATTYDQSVMGSFKKVTGILDMNAETGEITKYGVDEIPSYVDRVYPEEFFSDYISYYGKYKHGFWNSKIGQKEVQEATESFSVVYVDGVCYYYTGWTSTGKHESSNGIIMMNSRTGEIKLYQTYGIAESKAQGVAEGKVQEKKYSAGYPLLLKVAGEETYFSIMRDQNQNLVGYAFVSYKDYTKVAVGENLKEAQNMYIKALASGSTSEVFDDSVYETKEGEIDRISNEVVEGTTLYYVQLKGSNQMYSFYSKLEPKSVFAKAGDKISIKYIKTEAEVIAATEVDLKQ
ncbi:MAG: hypothetical protein Q4G58_17140 [bacterium]|nr:hypothetical protein [bacterium]